MFSLLLAAWLASGALQQGRALAAEAALLRIQGRLDEAVRVMTEAARLVAAAPDAPGMEIAACWQRLGEYHRAAGHEELAAAALRRAIPAWESDAVQDGGLGMAVLLNELGFLEAEVGRYREAEVTLRKALALKAPERLRGAILSNMARVDYALGRYAQADQGWKAALQIFETSGLQDQALASTLMSLGELRRFEKRYDEAHALLERALRLVSGGDRARALNHLGLVMAERGRRAEAGRLLQTALTEAERAPGPARNLIAAVLLNLTELRESEGRYKDADANSARALRVLEEANGPVHPSVGVALAQRAGLLRKMNRREEASVLEKRAQAILGTEPPATDWRHLLRSTR